MVSAMEHLKTSYEWMGHPCSFQNHGESDLPFRIFFSNDLPKHTQNKCQQYCNKVKSSEDSYPLLKCLQRHPQRGLNTKGHPDNNRHSSQNVAVVFLGYHISSSLPT